METIPPIRTPRLDLCPLPPALMAALLAGDQLKAVLLASFTLPGEFFTSDPDWHSLLELRLGQLRQDPFWAPWSLRAIVLRENHLAVGHANFHGPPGVNDTSTPGAAEMGYEVWPAYRNRGFATEVARGLMEWAFRQHGVTHFVSGVAPDNQPSLRVNRKLGFRPTGQVVDGEVMFELHYRGSACS